MKYIIKESQLHVDQSKVPMGQYGNDIRMAFEMYNLPHVNHYFVLYDDAYKNYVLMVYTNRLFAQETNRRIESYIENFIPVNVTVVLFDESWA